MATQPARDELVDLTTVHNEIEAGVIRAVLETAGVESWSWPAPGVGLGAFGAAMSNPTVVVIRKSDLEFAREVMNRNRQDSVDIDWNQVDVGSPDPE
jgi:hypothetical protein